MFNSLKYFKTGAAAGKPRKCTLWNIGYDGNVFRKFILHLVRKKLKLCGNKFNYKLIFRLFAWLLRVLLCRVMQSFAHLGNFSGKNVYKHSSQNKNLSVIFNFSVTS